MAEIGDGEGEYWRRKWETDEPEMPLPMMQTVEERDWVVKREKRVKRRMSDDDGVFMVDFAGV